MRTTDFITENWMRKNPLKSDHAFGNDNDLKVTFFFLYYVLVISMTTLHLLFNIFIAFLN